MWSLDSVGQSKTFDCLPAGTYRVAISACELKSNKAGTGKFVEANLDVVEPDEFAGQQIVYRATFEHKNATAMRIGQESFADFFFAATDPKPFVINSEADFEKLAGKELLVETVIETSEYQGKEYQNPLVKMTYSVKGKHRNDKRSLKSVRLGESNAAPVARRETKGSQQIGRSNPVTEQDLPF